MAYVDLPLSNFIGHSSEIIERLYDAPDMNNPTHLEERNDYDLLVNLPTIGGYKGSRDHTPSVIWDKEFNAIFGCDNVCIYDPYYILYSKIKEYIYLKFDDEGVFKYCFQSKDDDDVIGCYELNDKEDIVGFLVHIIQNVPCTLYDIKDNLGIN